MNMDLQKQTITQLALQEGTILQEHYRIICTQALDADNITYRAEDTETGTCLCIREYCPIQLVHREGMALLTDAEEPFRKGCAQFQKIASVLQQPIPHLAQVQAVFTENGTAYCVMPWQDGISPDEAAFPLTAVYLQSLGLALCETYTLLHKAGLCYGSLHKSDILFDAHGSMHLLPDGLWRSNVSSTEDMHILTEFLSSLIPSEPEEAETAGFAALRHVLQYTYQDAQLLGKALLLPSGSTQKPRTRHRSRKTAYTYLLCIFFLVLCTVGCIRIWRTKSSLQQYLASGSLQPDTVTVWLPLEENEDADEIQAMYERLAAGFEQAYPGFGVDVVVFADDSFPDALQLYENSENLPTVFMNTQDGIVLDMAAELTPLYNSLEDVYLTDLRGFGRSLPLGCSLPALYWNVHSSGEISDSFAAFETLSGFSVDASAAALAEQTGIGWDYSAFSGFLEDGSTPVLASTSCLAELQQTAEASGAVRMLPVSVDGSFPLQYEMYCSINRNSSLNSRRIGMLWLQYLLTEEAQEILFVEHYGDLPLHSDAFSQALEIHSELSAVSDIADTLDSRLLQTRR
jgi:hypothetical protein